MVSELKKKQGQIREKKLLGKDEVYHGALEDILLGRVLVTCSTTTWGATLFGVLSCLGLFG